MFIDTHAHIHDPEFNFDPKEVISKAHYAGVQKIITIGTSPTDSELAQEFAITHEGVYWSLGFHPGELTREQNLQTSANRACVEEGPLAPTSSPTAAPATRKDGLARERAPDGGRSEVLRSAPVAIGEIGLDYHYKPYNREQQINLFEEYLDLSKRLNLPCIFHVREAFPDFWPVVKNAGIKNAVLHSFSDTQENLNQAINQGFMIGINGIATFTKIPISPLSHMVLETDAPYLTPVPFRGKINEPAYIPEIARWVAQHLGTTLEEVAKVTTANAERLFNI